MKEKNLIKDGSINASLSGFYRVQVVDAVTNEVINDRGWNKNLILNQGMDVISARSFSDVTNTGVAGTGSRPNSISGGNSTITQSGAIITLWPGTTGLQNFSSSVTASSEIYYSSSLQVGDAIVYGNASQSNVLAIDTVAGLTASVDTSYTIESGSNQSFTIWKTSQVGLHKEIKRAGNNSPVGSSYLTGVGNCGSTDSVGPTSVNNVRTYRRTYDFVSESVVKDYTEIGTAWGSAGVNTVFSRVLLPTMVSVSASFRLRITYDLQVTFTPETQRIITASISGWPVSPSTNTFASESIQNFLASTISTDGAKGDTTACLDPALIVSSIDASILLFSVFISPSSASVSTFGTGSSRTINSTIASAGASKSTYVTGSYVSYKTSTFNLNEANRTDLRFLGFGTKTSTTNPDEATKNAIGILFHQTQSKANTQTLSFTWKWAWNRVLTG